jgi:hypothetical protein
MSLNPITVGSSKDATTMGAAITNEVNLIIQQLNGTANRLTETLNAQGNTVTNLKTPISPGDAVPLSHLNMALSTTTAAMFNILNRRTRPAYLNATDASGGDTIFNVVFKAAITQNSTPLLGMSFPSSTVIGQTFSDGSAIFAAEMFSGGWYVQDCFPLPDDWIAGSEFDCIVYWFGSSAGITPTWSCQAASVGNGTSLNISWNSATTAVGSASASMYLYETTLSSISVTGINPSDMLFFNFGRSDGGSDVAAALMALRFLIHRNIVST